MQKPVAQQLPGFEGRDPVEQMAVQRPQLERGKEWPAKERLGREHGQVGDQQGPYGGCQVGKHRDSAISINMGNALCHHH